MDTKIKIGVLVTDGNRVLLIKEKTEKQKEYRWNIIKGTYGNFPNEDIFEAAIRECKEEASIEVRLVHALGVHILKENNKTRVQFNFVAKIVNGTPSIPDRAKQEKRNEDISEVKWFSKNELHKMKEKEFVTKRSFIAIQDWLQGVEVLLSVFKFK